MDKIEIMKIQTIFGISWIELSGQELEKKRKIKKGYEEWKEKKDSNNYIWRDREESYYTERLEICQKLSEALNPDNWENLGANEIGIRIREFQNI